MPAYTPKQITLDEEYAKHTGAGGITPRDIAQFRQWLRTQPHLPGDLITDLDLILTYHCCDRSMEVSKQVLDLNMTLRTLFTNFFKDRTVDEKVEQVMRVGLMAPLKMRARDGSAVVYARLLDFEPKNFMFGDSIRTVVMLHDVWQLEEGTWPGLIMVFDLEGMKFGHLSRLVLTDVQQFLYYLQEAMLVKLKGLHYLNAPSFMDRFLMIIRPFLKKELLDALHVHQVGSTTIDKWIDIKALPKEAGGEYKTFKQLQEETQERLRSNEQYFKEENKRRVCENLRPGKPKTISDLFHGIEGSFKKLDID